MFKGTKLFMMALYVCSTLGCMGAYAAQRNVVAARNTTAQRSSVARATQSPRSVAPRAAVKTTTARAAANTVQSRAVAGPEKNISSRRGTQNRTTQARAGTTQTGVVLRSGAVESNLPIVKLYVDNSIIDQYANLKKYVKLSGDDGFVKLVNTGTLPNLGTLFGNISAKADKKINGAYTNNTVDDADLIYYDNGVARDDAENIQSGSSVHLIASGKLLGEPSTDPVDGAGNTGTCPAYTGTSWTSGVSDVRIVGANGTNVADCAIVFTDADGFCRMARWNGNTYGYYDGALTYGDPIVNCEKQNSHLDATVTVDVDADITTSYSNMSFEAIRVGIEYGQPLPSLAPLASNVKNKSITLDGVYKTRSMESENGVQTGTGKIWNGNGTPAIGPVSNMNAFSYKSYQNMYFAYAVWNKGAATVENTCSNKLSDYPGRMTGDTFVKAVQTTSQSSLSGIEDCAAIVHDSIGLCWALKMNNSARQLIPCADEINTYNLGYGMVRMNQFTPSGYNPDTYESSNTYYFLPWAYNNPVSLMDTNNGYTMVFRFRTTVGSSYGKDENGNTGMLQLPDLTKYVNNLTPPAGKKFAGIYSMWGKDVTETYHIYGTAGGDFTFTSTKLYDETGKAIKQYIKLDDLPWTYPRLADTGGRPFFMFIIWDDDIQTSDCPSVDESLAKYENASANISNGRLLSAPDGETISNQSACTWIFTDGDGMCRIGTYTYRPSSTTYYDWNGSIVACNTTTIGNDHGFDVDVGPIMDTVPTAFWDLDYLRLEDRLTYRYDTTLPSLKPYVDAAKGGTISGHYTFKGGYVGDSCSVTYSNGVPSVGSGCTRVYDDNGNPVKTLSSSDSDELTLAWDYSDNSRANYASICPTTRAEYNKDFNINSGYSFPEDEVSASCTVQRALVTSNNSIISPASDCAILCEDTLDVCYAKILNNNAGSSTGMVSCDTTGYVDTTKSVRILDDGSEGDAVNTVRYRTYLKDYAIRSGEHTIIFVQPSNTWPSVSNLIADLYHCGGANSHDGCTNGDDGKTFRGIYTEPNCAGTRVYDQNGDYDTATSVTYEDLPDVAWGDNHKKLYMCWLDPSTQLNPVSNCPRFDLNVQGTSWNGITPTKYVRAENEGDRKSDNTDCAIIYEDADGFCRIAPYKVQPAYQGLPAISVYTDSIYKGDGKWNISSPRGGPVVDCDKEYSDIDEELLVLTNAGGIKSNYDDRQSLLFNQLYVGIEYGKKLPSLAPLVNMNKYYLPNAVLVGGYSKNHMSAGGQPCAGVSGGSCVSLPESEKYWDADGEPVKTIASETELKNNFDGHDGLYEPSLLWNTANVTVADCPVPDGLSCADENEACDLSGRKTYPSWWMPKNVGTLSYVRSEFLFNVYGAIADCGVILKDENGTCWAVRNYRSCTAGETTCAPNQVECGE